jgi:hypothetical protein
MAQETQNYTRGSLPTDPPDFFLRERKAGPGNIFKVTYRDDVYLKTLVRYAKKISKAQLNDGRTVVKVGSKELTTNEIESVEEIRATWSLDRAWRMISNGQHSEDDGTAVPSLRAGDRTFQLRM